MHFLLFLIHLFISFASPILSGIVCFFFHFHMHFIFFTWCTYFGQIDWLNFLSSIVFGHVLLGLHSTQCLYTCEQSLSLLHCYYLQIISIILWIYPSIHLFHWSMLVFRKYCFIKSLQKPSQKGHKRSEWNEVISEKKTIQKKLMWWTFLVQYFILET